MRLYMTGVAALLVAVTGCDIVFSLDRPDDGGLGDGQLPYDRCGPFLYEEPLRYALVHNPNTDEAGVKAWSWSSARTACLQRGMDLAVFNDAHELGSVVEEATWPYWMGASRNGTSWVTVDDCPAMMPTASAADSCGIVQGPNTISSTGCTGDMTNAKPEDPPVVLAALCETPRPDDGSCLGNDASKTEYVMSPDAMSFAAARTFCADRGGRPVSFETHAEWLAVAHKVDAELHQRFWVGSTFDGTRWKSENKCPAQYAWVNGAPSEAPHTNDCLGSVTLDVPAGDGEPTHAIVGGVDRMECSAAEMHALCEI